MSAEPMHIVLVGFGNMGQALVAGWLENEAAGRTITVVDPSAAAQSRAAALGLARVASVTEVEAPADVALLAVKPDRVDAVLAGLPPASLYLSIAAGRTIAEIAAVVGPDAAIIRAMPNTPAAIGLGVTGLCANAVATRSDRDTASGLMSAVGAIEWLDNEDDMDALTAVSGSGPAYVFLLIECLIAAAIDAGLEPALARRLATGTVRGAGAYAAQAEDDAATLRRQVTSPRGTTEAALEVLLAGDALPRLIGAAVAAARRRSRELRSQAD